jgi:hypothetical protein
VCVCGLSQKPTPLIVTTALSCFHELVAFPQAASNFLRALMIPVVDEGDLLSTHRPESKQGARAAPALSPRESCRQPGERLGLLPT